MGININELLGVCSRNGKNRTLSLLRSKRSISANCIRTPPLLRSKDTQESQLCPLKTEVKTFMDNLQSENAFLLLGL